MGPSRPSHGRSAGHPRHNPPRRHRAGERLRVLHGGRRRRGAFSRAEDALAAAVDTQRAPSAWRRGPNHFGSRSGWGCTRVRPSSVTATTGPAVIRAARLMSWSAAVGWCSLATQKVVRPVSSRARPGPDRHSAAEGAIAARQIFAVLGPGLAERGHAIRLLVTWAPRPTRSSAASSDAAHKIDELTPLCWRRGSCR